MIKYRQSIGSKTFDIINHIIMLLFTFLCFYPFYYIFIYSISDSSEVDKKGVLFLPVKISFSAYQTLLSKHDIYNAAFISASRSVVGTIITIFCCTLFSYILTKKELFLRKAIYRYTIITMYLSPGLIPWYMTMKSLGLKNNFLLYILPGSVTAFYVILVKTFIEQLPIALEESAMVDGAGYLTVFFKIIAPLSKPIIATIAIFSAVSQWNSWQDNFYLISTSKLMTLQLLLYNYLSTSVASDMSGNLSVGGVLSRAKIIVTPMSIKMTISMITVIPIILVYPALQKYFVKGIMIGAIKG